MIENIESNLLIVRFQDIVNYFISEKSQDIVNCFPLSAFRSRVKITSAL